MSSSQDQLSKITFASKYRQTEIRPISSMKNLSLWEQDAYTDCWKFEPIGPHLSVFSGLQVRVLSGIGRNLGFG